MDDRFEATFVVEVSAAEAWRALSEARALRSAEGAGADQWWLPGFEATGEVLEVDPGRLIRVRKAEQPCIGTEIAVVLEATESGTRVTLVQSGFGAWFEAALEMLSIGWAHIVADFALYLEAGVRGRRHLAPWADPGWMLQTGPAGLEVTRVAPGSAAERLGLAPGDVLLALNGSPLAARVEVEAIARGLQCGDEVRATFARGRDLHDATAAW
jgi:uncharacterized protein YndB with AHSA1/START domain